VLNKGPAISQSDNLPPWQWKREKAPVHADPGGALTMTPNTTAKGPLLEDGKAAELVQVGCIESARARLAPAAAGEMPPQTLIDALEDGK
jgi:hypothetical protein